MEDEKVTDEVFNAFLNNLHNMTCLAIAVVAVSQTRPEEWWDPENAELVSIPIPPAVKQHFKIISDMAIESKIFDTTIRTTIETAFFTNVILAGITLLAKKLKDEPGGLADLTKNASKKLADSVEQIRKTFEEKSTEQSR